MNDMTDQQAATAQRLSRICQGILKGNDPEVMGAALADLLSLFIAGHHPALREEILTLHIQTVRDLIPASEKEVFAKHGRKPEGWGKQ